MHFDPQSQSLARFASALKASWRHGKPPNVLRVLDQVPELGRFKSIALDLIYEEYCCRSSKGERISGRQFAAQFGMLESSVLRLIEVHEVLAHDLSPIWPNVGEVFLGFELVGLLGCGAFAKVYLAAEVALGNRLVALKVSRHGAREANMLGQLRHPNIVPVHSITHDESETLTAICMPYLGHATFADLLDTFEGPPTSARAISHAIAALNGIERSTLRHIGGSSTDVILNWAIQLADALSHAHAGGICHGDLKPSNILISFGAVPMLLDFNLSYEPLQRRTQGGTLPYMAPEQLRLFSAEGPAQTQSDSAQSDLFSFGVVLYELLAGMHPYAAGLAATNTSLISEQLLSLHAKCHDPLHKRTSNVDIRLSRVIDSCLSYDPADRPSSAAELASSLRGCRGVHRRTVRWARGHKRSASLLCLVSTCACMGIGHAWISREPYAMRELSEGMRYFEQHRYQAAVESLSNAIECQPNFTDALFRRGRALLRLDRLPEADRDFQAVVALTKDPRAMACRGYCMGTLDYHRDAVFWYSRALNSGLETAPIHNNLGYSYQQLGDSARALKHFDRAVELNARLQAPHCNRALLTLRDSAAQRISESLADVRDAIRIGPSSRDLLYIAACVCAKATANNPQRELDREFFRYLEAAINLGASKRQIINEPLFAKYKGYPTFRDLLAKEPLKAADHAPVLILDPLVEQVPLTSRA